MNRLKDLDLYIERFIHKLIDFIPSLLTALLLLVVGIWMIRLLNRMVRKFFRSKSHDPTLEKFITSLIDWSAKILLFVLVVTQLGVESTSLVAMIGAAGLAIGLALQGSLANFAGGVLILVLRPFRVGDWISAQGVEGTVSEISIFNTKITTFGNQVAVVPNGKLSNDKILNYNALPVRRENLSFGIGYRDDIPLAKQILMDLVMEQEKIIKTEDKMPMVAMDALNESSVNLILRYWAKNEDFWNLRWYVMEEAKKRLEAAGIHFPFPQKRIHIQTQKEDSI